MGKENWKGRKGRILRSTKTTSFCTIVSIIMLSGKQSVHLKIEDNASSVYPNSTASSIRLLYSKDFSRSSSSQPARFDSLDSSYEPPPNFNAIHRRYAQNPQIQSLLRKGQLQCWVDLIVNAQQLSVLSRPCLSIALLQLSSSTNSILRGTDTDATRFTPRKLYPKHGFHQDALHDAECQPWKANNYPPRLLNGGM